MCSFSSLYVALQEPKNDKGHFILWKASNTQNLDKEIIPGKNTRLLEVYQEPRKGLNIHPGFKMKGKVIDYNFLTFQRKDKEIWEEEPDLSREHSYIHK